MSGPLIYPQAHSVKKADGESMKWYKKLYLGESIKQRSKRIQFQIAYGKHPEGYYCITLPENGKDLLEILPSKLFGVRQYPGKDCQIIGLAGDKEEALELVRGIIEEVYTKTGGFDIPSFLGIRRQRC